MVVFFLFLFLFLFLLRLLGNNGGFVVGVPWVGVSWLCHGCYCGLRPVGCAVSCAVDGDMDCAVGGAVGLCWLCHENKKE